MRYRHYICDVFTDRRFGGNQLAVLPEAEGLSQGQMQQIAREFNFKSDDDFDIRARMFAPRDGVPEDPARGSANCALAALLTHHKPEESGRFNWRIAQGVEVGRPSVLEARTEKWDGAVVSAWIGGTGVLVSDGFIEVD